MAERSRVEHKGTRKRLPRRNLVKRRAALIGGIRIGAKVHANALRLFRDNPERPMKEIYKEAIGGRGITKNQGIYLARKIRMLKRHYNLLKTLEKRVGVEETLVSFCMFRGLTPVLPGQIEGDKLHSAIGKMGDATGLVAFTKGKSGNLPKIEMDAFGFIITVDAEAFDKMSRNSDTFGGTPESSAGFTNPSLLPVGKGRRIWVPFTFLPEGPVRVEGTLEHERLHRENIVLGLEKPFDALPETRSEGRQFLLEAVRSEFAAHMCHKDPHRMLEFWNDFLKVNKDLLIHHLSIKDLEEIQKATHLIVEKAMHIMPNEELVEIIRTTPITKLNRRLRAALGINAGAENPPALAWG